MNFFILSKLPMYYYGRASWSVELYVWLLEWVNLLSLLCIHSIFKVKILNNPLPQLQGGLHPLDTHINKQIYIIYTCIHTLNLLHYFQISLLRRLWPNVHKQHANKQHLFPFSAIVTLQSLFLSLLLPFLLLCF